MEDPRLIPASHESVPLTGRSRTAYGALIEIAVAFVLVLLALWSYGPAQWILGGIALVWMLLVTLRSRPTIEELGLRFAGTRRALWIVILAALAAHSTQAAPDGLAAAISSAAN